MSVTTMFIHVSLHVRPKTESIAFDQVHTIFWMAFSVFSISLFDCSFLILFMCFCRQNEIVFTTQAADFIWQKKECIENHHLVSLAMVLFSHTVVWSFEQTGWLVEETEICKGWWETSCKMIWEWYIDQSD